MKFPLFIPLVLLAGCKTVGPDYVEPELKLPDAHRTDLEQAGPMAEAFEGVELNLSEWWTSFEDPVLTELIERSVSQNHDLRAALGRMREWQARLGVTRANTGPNAEANAQYQRSGISENTDFGLFPGQNRETDEFSFGANASWEIDLWGKLARSVEAAEADWAASVEEFWAVQVSLTGQVADAYLRLRELQSRLAIAQSNVEVLEQSVQTAQARFQAGLVQELDLLRARTDLASARATLPELQRAAWNATSEISLLVGERPGALDALLAIPANTEATIPSPSARLAAPVPADLLRRRPDIRQAERALAAQTARVGIATAERYPDLSLTGSLGYLAADSHKLLEEPSLTHSLVPALRLPIFSGGGLQRNIEVQEAGVEQALATFEATVLRALHEVDQSATGIRLESLNNAITEAQKSLDQSNTLYQEGLTNIDAVLDARRALFTIQDQAARARTATSRAHVNLYRALGGGWPMQE